MQRVVELTRVDASLINSQATTSQLTSTVRPPRGYYVDRELPAVD